MIKIVKRILFRRSGTRNMFRSRDSMAGCDLLRLPTSARGLRSSPVGQGVARGRAALTPRRRDDLDPSTGGLDRLDCALRERVGPHREGLRDLTAAEDLHQAALGDEAVRAQDAGVDDRAGVEVVERGRG